MMINNTNLEFYFIRHGESVLNTQPDLIGGRGEHTLLSEKGINQVKKLGRYLVENNIIFDEVFSSSLIRSVQTCEIACDQMNFIKENIKIRNELTEFTQGDWEGKTRSEIYTPEQLNQINTLGYLFTPPNGESQRMVERRVSDWLEDEVLNNPNYTNSTKRIAIFSHGLTIKCLLHYILGFNDRLIYRIGLDNTAFCKIRFTSQGWFPDSINEKPHLN